MLKNARRLGSQKEVRAFLRTRNSSLNLLVFCFKWKLQPLYSQSLIDSSGFSWAAALCQVPWRSQRWFCQGVCSQAHCNDFYWFWPPLPTSSELSLPDALVLTPWCSSTELDVYLILHPWHLLLPELETPIHWACSYSPRSLQSMWLEDIL